MAVPIWFERLLEGSKAGLVETCTPECNSPIQLLTASCATDGLLIDATDKISDSKVRLIKNCLSPDGLVYGSQENYEIEAYDANSVRYWNRGIKLLRWITKICLSLFLAGVIFPFLLLGQFGEWVLVLPAIYWLIRSTYQRNPIISWDVILYDFMAIVLIPKTIAVSWFYRYSKVGKTYHALKPFLISRVIFTGAGGLDWRGRFYLGQKAHKCDTDWFNVIVSFQRSIFCMNTLFKELDRELLHGKSHRLFQPRQRLSIAIGDSNMCQEATYLRVATTALVLDAIESGAIKEFPEVPRTIRSLRLFNNDPTLTVQVRTSRGDMSALEIQQFYLNVCRRYVESVDDPPPEANRILKLWSDVLYRLNSDQDSLFGRVDWITKRIIMRRVAQDRVENWEAGTRFEFENSNYTDALRKADLKYHELSGDGHYFRLLKSGAIRHLVNREEVEIAERMPPLVPLAIQRCRYIREFGSQIKWITWDAVKLINRNRVIQFDRNPSVPASEESELETTDS